MHQRLTTGGDFGTLYIVGTPIGHLGDMTFRALETLKSVDLIAAEDTRETAKILNHFQIGKKMVSYYDAVEKQKAPYLVSQLKEGKNIALVSSRGMPLLSDPGFVLVRSCREEGIAVCGIPGVSSLTLAWALAAMGGAGFVFLGFLPRVSGKLKKVLRSVASLPLALILFESPHRIVKLLGMIETEMGNREIVLCRELTKEHEEVLQGTVADIKEQLASRKILGEFTVVLSGHK